MGREYLGGSPLTDLMRAVIFVAGLANLALQTGPDLCSNTHSIAFCDGGDLRANFDSFSYNLVPNAEREIGLAPSTSDGVNITTADTACLNTDINIIITEWLRLDLWWD